MRWRRRWASADQLAVEEVGDVVILCGPHQPQVSVDLLLDADIAAVPADESRQHSAALSYCVLVPRVVASIHSASSDRRHRCRKAAISGAGIQVTDGGPVLGTQFLDASCQNQEASERDEPSLAMSMAMAIWLRPAAFAR